MAANAYVVFLRFLFRPSFTPLLEADAQGIQARRWNATLFQGHSTWLGPIRIEGAVHSRYLRVPQCFRRSDRRNPEYPPSLPAFLLPIWVPLTHQPRSLFSRFLFFAQLLRFRGPVPSPELCLKFSPWQFWIASLRFGSVPRLGKPTAVDLFRDRAGGWQNGSFDQGTRVHFLGSGIFLQLHLQFFRRASSASSFSP